MKKTKIIIAVAAVLILAGAIVFTVSAQTRTTVLDQAGNIICVEDGSCCPDPDVCTCN
jgi:hypothetical protein